MTNEERVAAREQYFEEYRQAAEQFANIKTRIKDEEERFNHLMSDLQESSEELYQRLNRMRRIVTFMLDTGCDPVEAKLKTEEHQQQTLWHDRHYNLASIGAMGAVGASSSITNGGTGSYNGMISVSSASAKLRV